MQNQPKWLYGAVLIILAVLAAGYFYWKGVQKPAEEPPAAPKASQPAVSGTLPSINTQTEINIPEINPVDKVNPFKDVYKNPFE